MTVSINRNLIGYGDCLKTFLKSSIAQRGDAVVGYEMRLWGISSSQARDKLAAHLADFVDLPKHKSIFQVSDVPTLSAIDEELRRLTTEMGIKKLPLGPHVGLCDDYTDDCCAE
jgi:hypothetical protein